jgi:hypothetical protein
MTDGFGEVGIVAAFCPPHMRAFATQAIAATAPGGFVRKADIGADDL